MAVPKDWKRFMVVYQQMDPNAPLFVDKIAHMIIVDRLTGVNYLYSYGGLTPLLDANGKPIVTPVDQL